MYDKLFVFFIKKNGIGSAVCVRVTLIMGVRERAVTESNIRQETIKVIEDYYYYYYYYYYSTVVIAHALHCHIELA
jgi:hypothetical protein